MNNEKIHTWCSCRQCQLWKTKKVRRVHHKKVRKTYKENAKKGIFETVTVWIWYTD